MYIKTNKRLYLIYKANVTINDMKNEKYKNFTVVIFATFEKKLPRYQSLFWRG
jgi:hypothetical protein